jgi:hypothetical protein
MVTGFIALSSVGAEVIDVDQLSGGDVILHSLTAQKCRVHSLLTLNTMVRGTSKIGSVMSPAENAGGAPHL